MVAPARYLDLDKFKFPFVMVNEYGLSSMRVAAFANLSLSHTKHCQVLTKT
jgi:hypothetical protein